MIHRGTQRLETERLILRPFVTEDAEAMFRNWAGDPEVTKYLMWQTYGAVSDGVNVLADWTRRYGQPDFYLWAIVLKELDEPIGSISVVEPIDERIEAAEIGYCIGRQWWHRGIVTEALGRVMDYLFEEVHVNRIEARHDPRNVHSGAVMRKCGMKYEGIHRSADWNNQGRCDAAVYALLAEER